jgi:hypothetical protein
MERRFEKKKYDANFGLDPEKIEQSIHDTTHRMLYFFANREIEIFTKQHRVVVGDNPEEKALIEFANSGTFTRAFSRMLIKARLEDSYVTFIDVVTTLGCSDKNARDMLQDYDDIGAVEFYKITDRKDKDQRLYFRSTPLGMRVYEKYFFLLYAPTESNKDVRPFIQDLVELWRRIDTFNAITGQDKQVFHNDYVTKPDTLENISRVENFTKVENISKGK